MRRIALLTCLLLIGLPPATAQSTTPVIAEVVPDPAAGEREFIEIWNPGDAELDLTGWRIEDEVGNAFTFGDRTLSAGARVVVWSGGDADARGPAWSSSSVWNNGGDQAYLYDASGSLVDAMAYGASSWPGDPGRSVPDTPATGNALALQDGAWVELAPTPGAAPDEQGGTVSAEVQDVAPAPAFLDVPAEVAPGAPFTVRIDVHDDNGAEDIASWRLLGDGAVLVEGVAGGEHPVNATAPSDRDVWTLTVEATDRAGQNGSAQRQVTVAAEGLVVVVPAGGIPFPAFPPGAGEVIANATFTLRNDASESRTPRIDVSDLTGPATIPVTGHLDIGYEQGGNTTWTAYDGPLTVLPALDPGATVEVRLRLHDLPAPLPAGAYGTSFAVVA